MATCPLLRSYTPSSIELASLAISLNIDAAPTRGFLPREDSPSCDLCHLTIGCWGSQEPAKQSSSSFKYTGMLLRFLNRMSATVASYYFFGHAAVRLQLHSCRRLLSTGDLCIACGPQTHLESSRGSSAGAGDSALHLRSPSWWTIASLKAS